MTYSTQPSSALALHGALFHPSQDRQAADVAQDQFGMRVAARLSEGAAGLPYDISERLRAARAQAVAKRKPAVRTVPAGSAPGAATTALSDRTESPGFWGRLASVLPLVALVVGLVAINVIQNEDRANELAKVDQDILTDELPPAAYADPGFVQFLRADAEHASQ